MFVESKNIICPPEEAVNYKHPAHKKLSLKKPRSSYSVEHVTMRVRDMGKPPVTVSSDTNAVKDTDNRNTVKYPVSNTNSVKHPVSSDTNTVKEHVNRPVCVKTAPPVKRPVFIKPAPPATENYCNSIDATDACLRRQHTTSPQRLLMLWCTTPWSRRARP